jgi:hypothetical protein
VEIENLGPAQAVGLDGAFRGEGFDGGVEWTETVNLEERRNRCRLEVSLDRPRLWWPHGMGKQNLYHLQLRIGSGEGGNSDEVGLRTGLKRIETHPARGKKEGEYDWIFAVNGQRVFLKGANWCLMDSLLRFPVSVYRRFLVLAKEAGIHLLRSWGGGLVETEEFFDLCDELGMMVWQEFPLTHPLSTNSSLPEGLDLRLVEEQAGHILRRLRNRASLLMWAGGNEHGGRGDVIDLLERLFPEMDPDRPFHRASPFGGDSHDWSVYHRFGAVTDFTKNESPFLSEFGLCSPPCMESQARFTPPEERNVWPPRWGGTFLHHTPEYGASPDLLKMLRYAGQYGNVGSLEDFVTYMQLSQGVALRTGIEHMRAGMLTDRGGAMLYKMNENYPGCSWSIVDWYGAPKIAYFFVRRAYQDPRIFARYEKVSWFEGQEFVADVLVAADSRSDNMNRYGELQAETTLFSSRLREVRSLSKNLDLSNPGLSMVFELRWTIPEGYEEGAPFFLRSNLRNGRGELLSQSVYWYNFDNTLAHQSSWRSHFDDFSGRMGCLVRLPATSLSLDVSAFPETAGDADRAFELRVANTGEAAAFLVTIAAPFRGACLRLEDNFFWLDAGETRAIRARLTRTESARSFVKSEDSEAPLRKGHALLWEVSAWNAPRLRRKLRL